MPAKKERLVGTKSHKDAAVLGLLLLVSFVLLFFSSQSFSINFKSLGCSLYSGVRGSIHAVSSFVGDSARSVKELASLRNDYDKLLNEVARYQQIERSTADILQENRRLKEQLGFAQSLKIREISAQITGRDPDNLYSALLINKGRQQGVSDNLPVVAFQDGEEALVGKVVQVGQFESLVMPIYDASCFVPARFELSRYQGLVAGQGYSDRPLVMTLINKKARDVIKVGDVVSTSGLSGVYSQEQAIYPPGVTIGRVSKIENQDYEMTMTVDVTFSLDFSRLEYVFVLLTNEGTDG
jgi:rod shape-determining protein MreC